MSHANKNQIAMLSAFMQEHPELARSYNASSSIGRTTQRQQWEQLARSLNVNGPPTKSVAEWKRVWTLRKYTTKKKLTHNKNSIKQTGGGPFDLKQLDDAEEAVIIACGMEASVSGIVGGLTFGSSEKENNEQQNQNESIEQLLEDLTGTGTPEPASAPLRETVNRSSTSTPRRTSRAKKEDDCLKKQIQLQENFFEHQKKNSEKANETLLEIRDAIRGLCDVKRSELEVANSLKKEELQIRRMELEVAQIANDIKLMEINSQSQYKPQVK